MKDNIVEFIFNDKKFKKTRVFISIILFVSIYYLAYILVEPSLVIKFVFIPVFMFFFMLYLLKIIWYNKVENNKTSKMDWAAVFVLFIVLLVCKDYLN
ncbi:hypothetical protein SAMN05216389_102174 [Oceanobacillus limi]|uniref:Uncharacterized protein n=1 Tax=Oceanobacillus limi TaxID=930131 RepID=A0A1H9ZCZ2_9BACI|nr:hypothetical protein SAMN05216389_102174 [Oceanobacillus limi]